MTTSSGILLFPRGALGPVRHMSGWRRSLVDWGHAATVAMGNAAGTVNNFDHLVVLLQCV